MVRFVILTLIAAQFVTGSSGSLYLCVREDGSHCCIDAGPDTCTCEGASLAHHPPEATCCDSHADEQAGDDSAPETAPGLAACCSIPSNGCTHLPLAGSTTQPRTSFRATPGSDMAVLALPAPVGVSPILVPHAPRVLQQRWAPPPHAASFASAVVMTAVLRC